MEPTQEEKQKFLEACGASVSGGIFTFNDGQGGFSVAFWEPTLDFLFKYAVPKSPEYNPDVRLVQHIGFDYGECSILDINGDEYIGESEDPAQALFEALEKVWKT